MQASDFSFAAIRDNGSVVTWGDPDFGGDSKGVQDQLEDVQHVQATERAFAAILKTGCVVTWGAACFGGDSNAVQDQLKDVRQIYASHGAFAAILGNGAVVIWRDDESCGRQTAPRVLGVKRTLRSSAIYGSVPWMTECIRRCESRESLEA